MAPKVFTVGPALKAFTLTALGGPAEPKAMLPQCLQSASLAEAGITGYPGYRKSAPSTS